MKNFLIILVSFCMGITSPLFAQIQLPANLSISSETERELLLTADSEDFPDLFILQGAANSGFTKADLIEYRNDIHSFTDQISERYKGAGDQNLLRNLFFKTHKKFLKHYARYSTFGELLDKGKYDCLTGTILYSLMLERMSFDYRIVETPSHIYIIINLNGNEVLFESTDPLNGFVYSTQEVARRLEQSEEGIPGDQPVSLFELVGLQYYNAAVQSYNDFNFSEAVDQIEKARIFYDRERLKEFGTILARAIVHSDMEQQLKTAYLLKLTQALNQGGVIIARN